MSTPRSDELLFAAGGDVWEKYGTFVKRTLPEEERGSFSRSSDATFRDRSEVLRTAESGILRPHYVSSESSYSARLEAARTNSILHSVDFSDADWAATATVTADDAVAPDGTTTADKIEDTDNSGLEDVRQDVSVSDDSLDRALSVFVKKESGTGRTAELELGYDGGSTVIFYSVLFDPTDGSGEVRSGGETPTRWGIDDYNSNYWRVWVVGANNGTGNTTVRGIVRPAWSSDSLDQTIEDGATNFLHVWGAQLEGVSGGASFPPSYIATAGSAVSRAVDDLSFPISFAPQELTVYVKFVERGGQGESNGTIYHIGDSFATGPRLQCRWGGGPSIEVKYEAPESSLSQVTIPTADLPTYGDVFEVRQTIKENGDTEVSWSKNGGGISSGTDSGASIVDNWNGATLYINSGAGLFPALTDFVTGPIIAPGVRTMDEMRSIEV